MSGELPRVVKARRGFSVSYRGKTLLSAVDPVAQGERAVDAAPPGNGTLYFCPSPLFGYGLSRLLERIERHEPDSAVLCVEACRELLTLPPHGGNETLPSHPRFAMLGIAGPDAGESGEKSAERVLSLARRLWGSRCFRRVEILRLSGGWQLYPELYGALAEALRADIAGDWGNAMTLVKLGRRYTRNFIRNLSLIPRCPSLSSLSFGKDPLLVLGAGPSLDSFLDLWEKRSPGGAGRPGRPWKILCVDTAIPCLKARGIKPDLVIALECQHWNLRDFTGARGWGPPLAMDLSALPATAEVLGGPAYIFFTPWTELRLFSRLERAGLLPEPFPPLGSVGLSATAAALRLSRGPVILCGIDFSFTLDSYHARSTPAHGEKLRRQNRFRGIFNQDAAFRISAFAGLSKSGRPVRSDPAMRNYRDLFEREFAAEQRLMDIEGSGLSLGLSSLKAEEAIAVLEAGGPGGPAAGPPNPAPDPADRPGKAASLAELVHAELGALERLREILRGKEAAPPEEFEGLLDFCGYVWAHFPECAAAGGRRPADISFLKRVRTEIEPFMGLWESVLEESGDRQAAPSGASPPWF
ncbi:MAG: DUF115 domain-containing protein [Treponema sp.]|jgi:hypothetical protein|nr:DUF115 domain-containing protein [Treponema sp.]